MEKSGIKGSRQLKNSRDKEFKPDSNRTTPATPATGLVSFQIICRNPLIHCGYRISNYLNYTIIQIRNYPISLIVYTVIIH